MKLKKRVQKDWASVQKRAGSMFNVYANDIGKMIDAAGKDIIGSIVAVLSIHPKITYKTLNQGQTIDRLSTVIHRRCEILAHDVEQYWGDKRQDFDLLARLSMNFITLKTSPPWIKKKLDLQTEPKDGRYDPRKGHLRFYFFNMADAIVKQVSQGALKEESLNQILSRVRAMFNRKQAMGVRENAFDPYGMRHDVNLTPDGEYQESLRGAVDITEGTYTLEDVSYFQDSQKRAMQWESREYRPWFSDELKRNNRYLRDLEQVLMSDAIDTMHSGQLQAGMGYPDEMGIQDFQWVVSRPQPTCDECTKRDELTMKEIKVQIKDEWGTQPPPLHPNCRCQLVPKISDEWSKKVLNDAGQEWDPETGAVYRADKQERDAGFTDMTLDEYLASVPTGVS